MDDKTNKYVAMIYTDGSAGPSNPGYYSTGLHGYIYDELEEVTKQQTDKPANVYMTNQGYIHRDDIVKYEFKHVKPVKYIDAAYSNVGVGTNNMGELIGVIKAIEEMTKLDIHVEHLAIYTDSTYAMSVYNHVISNDWESEPNKANFDLIKVLANVVSNISDMSVKLVKVPAHTGDTGNEIADRLAYIGRRLSTMFTKEPKNAVYISDPKKYWKPTVEPHPFINYRQLMYNKATHRLNNKYLYYVTNYKHADDEIGRKLHDASFGVVILNEREGFIEDVVDIFDNATGRLIKPTVVDITKLKTREATSYPSMFGDVIYDYNHRTEALRLLEEQVIAKTVSPPGLAIQLTNEMNKLITALTDYQANGLAHYKEAIEITQVLYEIDDKGKYKIVIDNVAKTVDINVKLSAVDMTIPIVFGKDIISRNQLKKLEKFLPKVYFVPIKLDSSYYEYFTVIECGTTKDISLWNSMFANKIFIKK